MKILRLVSPYPLAFGMLSGAVLGLMLRFWPVAGEQVPAHQNSPEVLELHYCSGPGVDLQVSGSELVDAAEGALWVYASSLAFPDLVFWLTEPGETARVPVPALGRVCWESTLTGYQGYGSAMLLEDARAEVAHRAGSEGLRHWVELVELPAIAGGGHE